MKKFVAEKRTSLTEFALSAYRGALSYSALMKLYRKKDIKINGARTNRDVELQVGDEVEIYYDGANYPIEELYKDDNILVCVKPEGISSEDYFYQVKEQNKSAVFTHRLDTNTRGIMIFALNTQAYDELYLAFKNRTAEKYYYCVVNGAFARQAATLNAFLKKDAENGLVYISDKRVKDSVAISTAYCELTKGLQTSLLEVKLITGKTHQIRAHLAHEGHFIIGDGKYGNGELNKKFGVSKQLLMSGRLILHFGESSPLYYLNGKTFSISYESFLPFVV